ncbi:MAG: FAD-dependent oxidoreductase [Bacteriovoracaceae bacterium]|nr:FAD-dependent oxidoreductase [Bacteriovoracaceae bacterium]
MALVKKYKSKVTQINEPIKDVFVVKFEAEKKFKFKPGQFLHLALDEYDPGMPWPESRCFSMQNHPGEMEVTITFAIKGNYTERMAGELYVGKEVWLKLPYGSIFTGNFKKECPVFIAGGTGITPFLSLFTDKEFNEYKNARLYFGIRKDCHNLYDDELNKAILHNPDFKINIINQEKSGILDIEKIFNEHGKDCSYFISGPPAMIKDFKNFLIQNGVNGEYVITDDWE